MNLGVSWHSIFSRQHSRKWCRLLPIFKWWACAWVYSQCFVPMVMVTIADRLFFAVLYCVEEHDSVARYVLRSFPDAFQWLESEKKEFKISIRRGARRMIRPKT